MKRLLSILLIAWMILSPFAAMAENAMGKLMEGNARYVAGETNFSPLTPERREDTSENGQQPYAVIVSCSDSRVPPEHIFSAGIGDLFVVRTAGNVLDEISMGSVEYGAEHLEAPLIVVMGHTGCGAVAAAIEGGAHGNIKAITDKIGLAIEGEEDARACEELSALATAREIKENPAFAELIEAGSLTVACAIYDIDSGEVRFLEMSE